MLRDVMRAHRLLCHGIYCLTPMRMYGTSALVALRARRPSVHIQPKCRTTTTTPAPLTTTTGSNAKVLLTPPPLAKAAARHSLLSFHPNLARTWLAAATNKMLQPQHVRPDSRKLVWWACPSCQWQFTRRIDLHVAQGGACPRCHTRPAVETDSNNEECLAHNTTQQQKRRRRGRPRKSTTTPPQLAALPTVVHRCRPDNSLTTLAAANVNRVKKSVADGCYLRVAEQRNLLPMLAKMYVKEARKIAPQEPIMVSPKLDGIRCIVAYDKSKQAILFFSRSGILFECCDAFIEPALRYAFTCDPTLVLDGELYNDSANLAKLSTLAKQQVRQDPFLQLISQTAPTTVASVTHSRNRAARNIKKKSETSTNDTIISFEQLVSAIRTTRERRTPAVAALQAQLQFHFFDVLYATAFAPHGAGSAVSYDTRYNYLRSLLAELHAYNATHITNYDPRVLRLVPSWTCVKANVESALKAATLLGYEGVMVRRLSTNSTQNNCKKSTSSPYINKNELAGRMGVTDGGYDYGQRSDCLLKYKLMQDDEFTIVAAVEGKGKWKRQLGAFLCETHDKKQTFSVAPASTDWEKQRMWRLWRARYKGQALTVQYQELTPDGVPRFPVAKCVRGAPDGKDWI